MNDVKKYTFIIPFIGHPSIAFKKSLAKYLIALIKNVVQYLKLLLCEMWDVVIKRKNIFILLFDLFAFMWLSEQ